ncbi:MAG TPA: riboflavin synthase [Terriglobales bacterium]|jgi:riboflavin synthase|nr:riboflavin synthase [Terriglobales bacterium]
MFTGLIEEIGQIAEMTANGDAGRLTVTAADATRDLKLGDSISVSGVCLTAVKIVPGRSFSADLAPETLSRTSLGRLSQGAQVNLELPMKAGARLGGHIVQGHVDGTGKLLSLNKIKSSDDYWLQISVPLELTRYIVEKGSITIEGISLTVAKVDKTEVSIAIIPHTYKATNLPSLQPAAQLNIEVDVLAKYAEKMALQKPASSSITMERLIEEGF